MRDPSAFLDVAIREIKKFFKYKICALFKVKIVFCIVQLIITMASGTDWKCERGGGAKKNLDLTNDFEKCPIVLQKLGAMPLPSL